MQVYLNSKELSILLNALEGYEAEQRENSDYDMWSEEDQKEMAEKANEAEKLTKKLKKYYQKTL